MSDLHTRNIKLSVVIASCVILLSACILMVVLLLSLSTDENTDSITVSVPANWDITYVENAEDYEKYNAKYFDIDWETYTSSSDEVFETYTINIAEVSSADFVTEYTAAPDSLFLNASDKTIAMLSENDAWNYISNGIWKSYPKGSFKQYASDLEKLKQTNTETITVKCWYWKNPKDDKDLSKTTVTKTFAVNSKLADTFRHIFEDIYNHPSKPIINIADGGMGTWVLRGKNHNSNNSMSAHSLGAAIDINPSTGSFNINGSWYGNAYGQKVMTASMWRQLPEVQKKYHVLYNGCPIVEIFKSYGFYWGGDWNSTKDVMHLSYIGDGSNSREKGIKNYKERN